MVDDFSHPRQVQFCRRADLPQRQPGLASPLEAFASLLTSLSQLVLYAGKFGLGTAHIRKSLLPCLVCHSQRSLLGRRDAAEMRLK